MLMFILGVAATVIFIVIFFMWMSITGSWGPRF